MYASAPPVRPSVEESVGVSLRIAKWAYKRMGNRKAGVFEWDDLVQQCALLALELRTEIDFAHSHDQRATLGQAVQFRLLDWVRHHGNYRLAGPRHDRHYAKYQLVGIDQLPVSYVDMGFWFVEQLSAYTPPVARSRKGRPGEPLSSRQIEIVQYLANGYEQPDIARLMGLSVDTIKHHTKVARTKMEQNTSAALVAQCMREGLVQ